MEYLTNEYLIIAAKIGLILLVGLVAYHLIRRGLRMMFVREHLPDTIYVIGRGLLKWVIVVIVSLAALQQAGVSVSSIWAAVSAFAVLVAVGFVAVWSILSNILCSLLLVIFAPFRIGDEIEIIEPTGGDGLRGRVVGLNILYTTLTDEVEGSARLAQVPNNIFFQKTIRRRKGVRTRNLTEELFKKKDAEAPATA